MASYRPAMLMSHIHRLTKPISAMDGEGYCGRAFSGYTHVYWTWLKTRMDPGVGITNKPLSDNFIVLVLITLCQRMLPMQISQTPLNSALSQSRHSTVMAHLSVSLSLVLSLSPYLSDALVQAAALVLLFFSLLVCWTFFHYLPLQALGGETRRYWQMVNQWGVS